MTNIVAMGPVQIGPITDTSAHDVVPAVAGARIIVTHFTVANQHASAGTLVQLLAGSTPKDPIPAAAPYGGCARDISSNPIRCAVNEAFRMQASVTSNVLVTAYYKLET
jgi:hypothetical protein